MFLQYRALVIVIYCENVALVSSFNDNNKNIITVTVTVLVFSP